MAGSTVTVVAGIVVTPPGSVTVTAGKVVTPPGSVTVCPGSVTLGAVKVIGGIDLVTVVVVVEQPSATSAIEMGILLKYVAYSADCLWLMQA